jgi:hypothetical protein
MTPDPLFHPHKSTPAYSTDPPRAGGAPVRYGKWDPPIAVYATSCGGTREAAETPSNIISQLQK